MKAAWAVLAALIVSGCSGPRPVLYYEDVMAEADSAFYAGDFDTAELQYRRLLEVDPELSTRLRIAMCVQRRQAYVDARVEYEAILAGPEDAHDEGLGPFQCGNNVKAWALIGLGQCFEAEGRWDEALAAYIANRRSYPLASGCGNCRGSERRRELARIARCIEHLVQD